MLLLGRLTRSQTCCGFISLRLGCLIIGYLETVGNLYGIYKSTTGEDEWVDVILYISGSSVLILLNLLMIWGIYKQNKKFLLPWLIIKFVAYLGFTLYYGYQIGETILFLLPNVDQKDLQYLMIMFLSVFSILMLLAWYTFFCVYSYYKVGISSQQKTKEGTKLIKRETNEEIQGKNKKDNVETKKKQ